MGFAHNEPKIFVQPDFISVQNSQRKGHSCQAFKSVSPYIYALLWSIHFSLPFFCPTSVSHYVLFIQNLLISLSFCNFISPLARLFIGFSFIDIFAASHLPSYTAPPTLNDSKNTGAVIIHNAYTVTLFRAQLFFPRRPCTLMGVHVWCPNDPVSIVGYEYGRSSFASVLPVRLCNHYTGWFLPEALSWNLFEKKREDWKVKWSQRFDEQMTSADRAMVKRTRSEIEANFEKILDEESRKFSELGRDISVDEFCEGLKNQKDPHLYSLCRA